VRGEVEGRRKELVWVWGRERGNGNGHGHGQGFEFSNENEEGGGGIARGDKITEFGLFLVFSGVCLKRRARLYY
jgi:hypothetical protein